MTNQTRKQWTEPQLKVLGDVESLTLVTGKEKHFGGVDGFLFENQSISG